MFAVQTVLDLSPGCGMYAQACLRNSTGYVGFCWTNLHRERMEQRLKLYVLREMVDESSPLFSPVVCDHIDFTVDDGSALPDGQKPGSRKQKAATKKRAQKAASAKGKHNKNGASDDVEPPAKKKPRKTKPDKAQNPQEDDAGEDDEDDEDDEDAGSDWDLSE